MKSVREQQLWSDLLDKLKVCEEERLKRAATTPLADPMRSLYMAAVQTMWEIVNLPEDKPLVVLGEHVCEFRFYGEGDPSNNYCVVCSKHISGSHYSHRMPIGGVR